MTGTRWFFLLLVYLHFFINFKCAYTVCGVYDVIAIVLLFRKSKIQSSTRRAGAVHRHCDRGLAFSVCVCGQTPKSGAQPVLAPPIVIWALPTPGLTWWITWTWEVMTAGHHVWNPLRPFRMSQGQIPSKDPLKSFEPETWELLCKWGMAGMCVQSYQEKVKGRGGIALWEENWRTSS